MSLLTGYVLLKVIFMEAVTMRKTLIGVIPQLMVYRDCFFSFPSLESLAKKKKKGLQIRLTYLAEFISSIYKHNANTKHTSLHYPLLLIAHFFFILTT